MANPKYLLNLLLFFSIIVGGIFFSFVVSNNDNPVRLENTVKQEIYKLAPQGWAFFTKSPKEETIQLYEKRGNQIIHLNGTSSLLLQDLLGVRRNKRKLNGELTEIAKRVHKKHWTTFNRIASLDSLKILLISDTIRNNTYDTMLIAGEKIICVTKPTPWAWSNSEVVMPSRCVKIHIK